MENKLTYSDVVEDTVKYYSEDFGRRCISYSACSYFDPDTKKMCAVGRYMKHPEDFSFDAIGEIDFIGLLENHEFKDIMKDEVSHLENDDFWVALQTFHDASCNYNSSANTLSERGLETVEKLRTMAKVLDHGL